jgi:phycocyanin-associated, rod
MLGQSAFSRDLSTTADNRIFVYEITGLNQDEANIHGDRQVRLCGNSFVRVPFHRMNATMQRIINLGGKIVNIHPLWENAAPSE